MPVTARLSKKFYDRFGEDVANELVDWFNAMDATYQTQVRELNELNYRRFLADLRAEIATARSDIVAELAAVRSDLRAEIATVRSDISAEIGTVRSDMAKEIGMVRSDLAKEIAAVRSDVAGVRAELIKWMFAFGTATVVSLAGLIVALEKLFK